MVEPICFGRWGAVPGTATGYVGVEMTRFTTSTLRTIARMSLFMSVAFLAACTSVFQAYAGAPRSTQEIAVIFTESTFIAVEAVDGRPTMAAWDLGAPGTIREIRLLPGYHELAGRFSDGYMYKDFDVRVNCAAGKRYRFQKNVTGYAVTFILVEIPDQPTTQGAPHG